MKMIQEQIKAIINWLKNIKQIFHLIIYSFQQYLQICPFGQTLKPSYYLCLLQLHLTTQMDSIQNAQKSQTKKTNASQSLKNSRIVLSKSRVQFEANKDIKQSQIKTAKEKPLENPKQPKKAKSRIQKEVSQEQDDDQQYKVQKQKRPRKRKTSNEENQNQTGQKIPKKRGRKPKAQPETKEDREKEHNPTSSQPANPESAGPIVKKRGRPKGSTNKTKEKKEVANIPKQFQCLKKIQPKQKSASSLQDESDTPTVKNQASGGNEDKTKSKQNVPSEKNASNLKKEDEKSASGSSESSGSSQQASKEQQKQQDKNGQDSQSQQSQSEISQQQSKDQENSQKNKIKNPPLPSANPKQSNKAQQSLALPRGKKLNIKSSSQSSENVNKLPQKVNQVKINITEKLNSYKEQVLAEEQQLARLMKKRGRKSQQTQQEIEKLKEIINKKKASVLKQKLDDKSTRQKISAAEIQSQQEESKNQNAKKTSEKTRKTVPVYPKQNRIIEQKEAKSQSNVDLANQEKLTYEKQLIQKGISDEKKTRLSKFKLHPQIYTEQLVYQQPVDPLQLLLFKGWTKHYKKYIQAVSMQVEEQEIQLEQKMHGNRKRVQEKKFKRYRKVIIENEDSQQYSSNQQKVVKKAKKEKRSKEPVKMIIHKKSKSKRKHKDVSSSENYG